MSNLEWDWKKPQSVDPFDDGGLVAEMSQRIARTVAALRAWRHLHYVGVFRGFQEMESSGDDKLIEDLGAQTEEVLREWGYKLGE